MPVRTCRLSTRRSPALQFDVRQRIARVAAPDRDQQHACECEAGHESIPEADHAAAESESQRRGEAHSDGPVRECGDPEGQPGFAEASQGAYRHHLGPVEELEGGSYRDRLKADADVSASLTEAEIDALFDLDQHFRHVDTIFARVFGAPAIGGAG